MNLTELLDTAASRSPHKPAIIEGPTSVTYAALVQQTESLARRLRALGLKPGARVGLRFPNSAAYVALTFALWRAGAVVVPIPLECTDDDISTISESMSLEGLISQTQRPGSHSVSSESYFTPLAPERAADNHGLNIAFIRFTSGTTSARKGVVLTHETIRDRIAAANKAIGIGQDDTVMWCLPMSHHFLITITLYLSQGATIVLARHVTAQPFLEAINRWNGTVLYAAPFHYSLLARDNSGAGIPSVRLAVSTTCALPQDVAEDFCHRFNLPLTQALGIIEAGLVSFNRDDSQQRWDSVGRPTPDFEVQILAPDDDGCGEIAVKGPGMFDAYASPWVPSHRLLHNGWFITGDIGRLDPAGFLYLAGRTTAVINLAGRKVFPEEIEAVLNRHPAVRESRAYGRVHPHLGEVVEADLVLAQTDVDTEDVRTFCRSKLASFMVPCRLTVVDSLPRTAATGKIRRAAALAQHG